jgi:hypothetical protein
LLAVIANILPDLSSARGMKPFPIVVAAIALAAVPAQAAVVWSTGPDNLTNGDNLVFGIAEQFRLTSITQLTDLLFWQGEFAVSPDPSDIYFWEILSDASGSPGALIDSGLTSTYTKTSFGSFLNGGFTINSYEISFPINPGLLSAGTYWLKLRNNTGAGFWDVAASCGATCPDGTPPGALYETDPPSTHNLEYAFQLSGTGAPEPSTTSLLLSSCLIGFCAYRRSSR